MKEQAIFLEKCPFCGGEAEEEYAPFDYNENSVKCTECAAYMVQSTKTYQETINAWNNRVK